MSTYSITTANADLAAVLHGTNLNKIQNLNGLHNRTARQLLLDIDPQETIRKILTTTPLYNQVWDYACPVDLKGDRVIDISPQYYRNPGQIIGQQYNQDFDIKKNYAYPPSEFTIQFNNGVKTIRIQDTSLPSGAVVDTMDAVGNWTAGGTASNLQVDNVNYAEGSGSLSFNLAAGSNPSIGSISETAPTPFNLTTQLNQGSFFVYAYFPDGTAINSLTLRWGSDASDYYSVTSAVTNENTAFQTGWNLVRFDWLGALVTGSPNVAALSYFYLGISYNGALQTAVRLDNLVCNMGLYRTIEYYSKYLFSNASTGAFQETVLANTDLLNLDTESYNLYFNLLAFYGTQQIQGLSALFFDDNFFGQQYQQGKTRYTSLNKSQVQKPRTMYYTPQKGGYGKYLGRKYHL